LPAKVELVETRHGAYVLVGGRTIQALKARINIAQGKAMGNDLQES